MKRELKIIRETYQSFLASKPLTAGQTAETVDGRIIETITLEKPREGLERRRGKL